MSEQGPEQHRDKAISNALRIERNQAYRQAVEKWREIRALDPSNPRADAEIARLNTKIEQNQRIVELKFRVEERMSEILPVYTQVLVRLKRMEREDVNDEAEVILDVIDNFLTKKLSAREFLLFWLKGLEAQAGKGMDQPDYAALAERLRHSEVVLFLGANIPALFDHPQQPPEELTADLADYVKYAEFTGSFPEICEYLELNAIQYGRPSLRRKLLKLVNSPASAPVALYELLASSPEPLMLISACYDPLLENAFRQKRKKFVLVSHANYAEESGTLYIEYSDGSHGTGQACLAEELSDLQVLEQGYSLIYKIRGCFSSLPQASFKEASAASSMESTGSKEYAGPDNEPKRRLTDLLLACPTIENAESRHTLLKELPSHIVNAVQANDNPKMHVLNIVNTCIKHSDGLAHLLDTLRFFDGKTNQFRELAEFAKKFASPSPGRKKPEKSYSQNAGGMAGDGLMLSEQDYFAFAKHIDKLIPGYVLGLLHRHGFWLLGHYPRSWENRLLLQAVLKNRGRDGRALTVDKEADPFARAYWEHNGVKNYLVDLKEFVEKLQAHI
ncbi:MAG: hypothetical protein GY862_37810 [Gammaproteobacteria bacterium]|nr:hypothetical protein [Gammaproteobacteria bacterium]